MRKMKAPSVQGCGKGFGDRECSIKVKPRLQTVTDWWDKLGVSGRKIEKFEICTKRLERTAKKRHPTDETTIHSCERHKLTISHKSLYSHGVVLRCTSSQHDSSNLPSARCALETVGGQHDALSPCIKKDLIQVSSLSLLSGLQPHQTMMVISELRLATTSKPHNKLSRSPMQMTEPQNVDLTAETCEIYLGSNPMWNTHPRKDHGSALVCLT